MSQAPSRTLFPTTPASFARFAWGLLAYNLGVIVWGAYVRASGSGAGCGAHWPLCNGELIPRSPTMELLVELSHRVTAGLTLGGSIALVWLARRTFDAKSPVRKGAWWVFGFTMAEALIGAGLVLYRLVEKDDSTARVIVMCLHLMSTFVLLGWLTLTAWWASGGARMRVRGQGAVAPFVLLPIALMFLLGASGAIAALGDTLFPAKSWAEGMAQDLSPTVHMLLRLRLFHPMLAAITAVSVIAAATAARVMRPGPRVARASRAVTMVMCLQLLVGLANVAMLAPVPMQLVHLFVADLVWIALVMLAATALADQPIADASAFASAIGSEHVRPRQT